MKIKSVKHRAPDIKITTWQSIYKQPASWFKQFDVVIGDEAHQFKAKSLTSIMENMTNIKYRIGTTGSLDGQKVNRLVLEGLFGPLHRITTTKNLQDTGRLAPLKIKAIMLKYPEEVRSQFKKIPVVDASGKHRYKAVSYQEEINFLIKSEQRNRVLRNLTLSLEGNTLVLFQYVQKHGKIVHEMIKEKAQGRKVFFVCGETDVQDREDIRHILSVEKNAILVASFGTLSTGIDIPSIQNIVFAFPFKSVIRTLQSIGRGLRLNNDKEHCTLFDITDDLHWKTWKNHTLKHGAERYRIYAKEEFPVSLKELQL